MIENFLFFRRQTFFVGVRRLKISRLIVLTLGALFAFSAARPVFSDDSAGETEPRPIRLRGRALNSSFPKPSGSAAVFPFKKYDGYDYQIRFRRAPLLPAETLFIAVFEEPLPPNALFSDGDRAAYKARLDKLRAFCARLGIAEGAAADFSPDKAREAAETLAHRGVRTVLFAGISPASETLDALVAEKIVPVVLRDLAVTPDGDFHAAERGVVTLEERGLESASTGDLLDGDDFHFPSDRRKSVVFLVSDDHYNADKTLPIFAEDIGGRCGYRVGVIHGLGGSDFRPVGLLDSADLLVVFTRRLAIPAVLLEKIQAHLNAGRPLLGMRTASHGFAPNGAPEPGFVAWPEFDRDVLGGNYHQHGSNDAGTHVVAAGFPEADEWLPSEVRGEWRSAGSLYYTSPVVSDAVVLQTGRSGETIEPLTWVRRYGPNRARIVYTGLGHPDDFNVPAFRALLTGLIAGAL